MAVNESTSKSFRVFAGVLLSYTVTAESEGLIQNNNNFHMIERAVSMCSALLTGVCYEEALSQHPHRTPSSLVEKYIYYRFI